MTTSSPPIRVLYVLNAMGGGASLGIYEFLRRMPKQRIAAYAVVPPGTAQQFEQMRPLFEDVCVTPLLWWNRKTELDPIRRAARAFGSLRRGITLLSNVQTIKSCIERWQIDLVHTGTALTLAGPLAAQAVGVPNLWHIKESIGSRNRVRFALPDDQLVAYMDELSASIIAMSDYIGAIFREHGSKKLTIIPDGVDLSRYQDGTSRNLRDQLRIDEQTVLVGMVAGTTSTWKRHDLFIAAAARVIPKCPNARFVIVGEKPNPNARFPNDGALRYYLRLVRQADQIRAAGRFEFVDHVADPADLMRSLDILVHPCDTEPFGRVAIEAQAAGTPVVGTTTGGIAETVIDGVTGRLVAPDAAAFAGAIEQLISDPNLRRQWGAAGKAHAASQYPVDAMLQRLTALYENLLSEAAV